MFEAMRNSSLGDDVYEEDETNNEFQERIRKLTGKEACIFAPSGTMTNQIGVRVNLGAPPHSIVCDTRAHIYRNEASGLAILSQAIVYPATAKNGKYITLEDIQEVVVDVHDVHVPLTKLICLENTISGVITPIEEIKRISEYAKSKGMKMHLDGARLWNASAETGVSLEEYCKYFDTVSICLSKGLGAPIGSVLVGSKEAIDYGRWIRKQQGGGMRQVGILAAAANVGVDEVWPNMKKTHDKVKALAKVMADKYGYKFEVPVETNFIFIDVPRSGINIAYFEEEAKKQGFGVGGNRLAFHYQIAEDAYDKLAEVARIAKERSVADGIEPIDVTSVGAGWAGSKAGSFTYAPSQK